jgi:aldose 1-epimerase
MAGEDVMSSEIATLVDQESGHQARVLVSQGFNCFSWTRSSAGRMDELLWSTPQFSTGTERASSSGIPILFPFPGRLRGTEFRWQGKEYRLEPGDAFGNAIHGFVHTRPWRVVEQQVDRVTAEIQASVDDPELASRWPGDFHLVATYHLHGGRLQFDWQVTNCGEDELPFGLGVHPYFNTHLFGSTEDDLRLQVPVDTVWELHEMLPTGRFEPDPLRLEQGTMLSHQVLDHVFEKRQRETGHKNRAILGTEGQSTIAIEYGEEYPFCIVYTPGHRESICIEPYTCLPNSPEFLESVDSTGWRCLAQDEVFRSSITYMWT